MFTKHMRLGRDPEMRKTSNGNKAVYISAAYDTYVGGENKTTWVNISLFDRQAEFIMKYGKKGYVFKFSGEIWTEEYDKRDGSGKGMSLNMLAESVKFPEVRSNNQSNNNEVNNQSISSEPVNSVEEDYGDSFFDDFFEEQEGA